MNCENMVSSFFFALLRLIQSGDIKWISFPSEVCHRLRFKRHAVGIAAACDVAIDSLEYWCAFFFMLDDTLSELLNLEPVKKIAIVPNFHAVANETELFELQCRENIEDCLRTKRIICEALESLCHLKEIANAFDHRDDRPSGCFWVDPEGCADIGSLFPSLFIGGLE